MLVRGYEPVIGLEIHAQLLTQSKMFCRCSTRFEAAANENICPICVGMPGALPVVNHTAIEYSIKTGLALNCKINERSIFARKNYFYPDLPKGYQISQFEEPLCSKGYVEFFYKNEKRRVGVTRAHMEEDAGKSIHEGEHTLVDYNRSSMPLLEIVSEPDMREPAEAAEYARTMRNILRYLEVCDGNLEEGSMRCDCNVSVRKAGAKEFGTKVEIKNINSFRFVEKAIEYEINRQIDCLETGQPIVQETRLYDIDKNRTFSMRSKEDAHDYRYFPDPDLLPVEASPTWVEKVRSTLPEMPVARAIRFQEHYKLPEYDSFVLTQEKVLASYFEKVAEVSGNPKGASNWVMVELLRELNDSKKEVAQSPIKAEDLGQLIRLIDDKTISGKIAKTVFADMWTTGKPPQEILKQKNLSQITDPGAIEKIVMEAIQKNPGQVAEFRSGKEKLFGFFVGQVMKLSQGQANPDLVNQVLREKLKS